MKDTHHLARLRFAAQLLAEHRRRSAEDVVRHLIGIQAQELTSAHLSIRARTSGSTRSDVERSRIDERAIVWTWAMRGTLHFIAAADAGWLLPLVMPTPASALRRLAMLGVRSDQAEKASGLIAKLVEEMGSLTRTEVAERLARLGIRAGGRAVYHLVRFTALRGGVCLGSQQDHETMVIPMPLAGETRRYSSGDAALEELARRYLAAYGPASAADLSAWSGLTPSAVRTALGRIVKEVREMEIDGQHLLVLRRDGRERADDTVRLLPAYDPYLLGYRRRDFALPRPYARRVHPGGGLFRPIVMDNGSVVATWRIARDRRGSGIAVAPFDTLDRALTRALAVEAEDVGRFLEGGGSR